MTSTNMPCVSTLLDKDINDCPDPGRRSRNRDPVFRRRRAVPVWIYVKVQHILEIDNAQKNTTQA